MEKIDYGFVILHYEAMDMTIKCIDDINNISIGKSIKIIIVDNASSNKSGVTLQNKYKDINEIEVLLLHKNLGFAQGNNYGYLFLKCNYDCKYMIIMNNDVLIEQSDFLKKIDDLHIKTNFAVLGPDIYSPKLNDSQSPTYRREIKNLYGRKIEDIQNIYNNIKKINTHFYYYKLRFLGGKIFRFFVKKKNLLKKEDNKNVENLFNPNIEYENVVLHGACYIFSKDYINKRKLCFNPNTFLYFEEDILHFECLKENLKMVYSPKIKVIHLEDVSTDTVYKTSFKKSLFINKNLEASLEVYLNMNKNLRGGVQQYSRIKFAKIFAPSSLWRCA